MNILDENIPESQRQLLHSWGIQTKQIGHEIGRQGMKDDEIIPLLHKLRYTTFFTRDLGFHKRQHCHPNYCLVILAVGQYEVASFIRRFPQYTHFATKIKRMGKVVRVTHVGIQVWHSHAERQKDLKWL
jgi:hypothetical protein